MATPNPDHLLEQAQRLASASQVGAPRQADLRRAVSTAYYALFHFVLAAASDLFVGTTRRATAEYGRVYRSIDHRTLRELCEDVGKPKLPAKYSAHVPAKGLGPNVVAFAGALLDLQEKRHSADYDPMIRVTLSDAKLAIETAETAIASFERASGTRKRAFLSLLLFPPRR